MSRCFVIALAWFLVCSVAGLAEAASLSEAVLVVIDVQLGFTKFVDEVLSSPDQYSPRLHVDAVMSNLVDFVDRWLEAGGEVIVTQYVNPAGVHFSPLRVQYDYRKFNPEEPLGREQIRFDPRLEAVLTNEHYAGRMHVVQKVTYGAVNELFEKGVAQKGWTSFALAGFNTNACVLSTANQMFDKGFKFSVLEDIVAADGPIWGHNYAIEHMKSVFDPYGTGNKVQTTDKFLEAFSEYEFRSRLEGIKAVAPGPRTEIAECNDLYKHYGYDMNDDAKAVSMWGGVPDEETSDLAAGELMLAILIACVAVLLGFIVCYRVQYKERARGPEARESITTELASSYTR